MYDIHTVELFNYKSWRGKHVLKFPTAPGLYFLTGENKFNPRLEANAVGKSSLLDAIYWVDHGATPRGLKAANVITRGEKSCYVIVDRTIGNLRFKTKRTQNPNSIQVHVNGEWVTVDQKGLLRFTQLNADAFKRTVMRPQKCLPFFDLSPTEKLTLFSQVMDLDYWLDCSKEADARAKALEGEVSIAENHILVCEGLIKLKEEDLPKLEDSSKNFKASIKAAIAIHKGEIVDAEAQIALWNERRQKYRKDFDGTKRGVSNLQGEIKWLDDQIKRVEDEKLITYGKLQQARAKKTDLLEALDELSELGAVCPTCRQKVDKIHLKREKSSIEERVHAVDTDVTRLEQVLANHDEDLAEGRNERKKAKAELEAMLAKQHAVANDFSMAQTQIDIQKRRYEEIEKKINELRERENPYLDLINQVHAAIEEQKAEIEVTAKKLEAHTENLVANQFWVSGFKRVRLFIIENVVSDLEIEVNNCLASLGLTDWTITFDVEREKKDGGITKGFSVFIQSPSDKEPVPWESFSGGEEQRLCMAGDIGLANLIMRQMGLQTTVEFYDEPSQHLSAQGIIDLAETLARRAVDENKKIWIVDHNIPDFGGYAGIIRVVRDAGGRSQIESGL